MIEPKYLERDELHVECEIRGIRPTEPGALDKIKSMLLNEFDRKIPAPTTMHKYRTLTTEMSEIDSRIAIIHNSIKEHLSEMTPMDTDMLTSRLRHWKGRVERVLAHNPNYKATCDQHLRRIEEDLALLGRQMGAVGNTGALMTGHKASSTPFGSADNLHLPTSKGAKPKKPAKTSLDRNVIPSQRSFHTTVQ